LTVLACTVRFPPAMIWPVLATVTDDVECSTPTATDAPAPARLPPALAIALRVLTAPASRVVSPVVVMCPAALTWALVLSMAIATPRAMESGLVSASEVPVAMAVKLEATIELLGPRSIEVFAVEYATPPKSVKLYGD
jgi:hypothetical protein